MATPIGTLLLVGLFVLQAVLFVMFFKMIWSFGEVRENVEEIRGVVKNTHTNVIYLKNKLT